MGNEKFQSFCYKCLLWKWVTKWNGMHLCAKCRKRAVN